MPSDRIAVQDNYYELITDVKDGWNDEAFQTRYSDILSRYDYIVGDWGYDQLRLKGFFDDIHRKTPHDSKIGTLPEYIYEYCNFGCAYFVIKKVQEDVQKVTK